MAFLAVGPVPIAAVFSPWTCPRTQLRRNVLPYTSEAWPAGPSGIRHAFGVPQFYLNSAAVVERQSERSPLLLNGLGVVTRTDRSMG